MLISPPREEEVSKRQVAALRVKTPSIETRAMNLSGGNQQKVVLGKWLSLEPKVIIFDEPTRGIDVGAKAEIYRLMRELADRGVTIIMISSDMEEVLGVSDRIAVMHEGDITGFLAARTVFGKSNHEPRHRPQRPLTASVLQPPVLKSPLPYEEGTRHHRSLDCSVCDRGSVKPTIFRRLQPHQYGAADRHVRDFQYRGGPGDYHGRHRPVGGFGVCIARRDPGYHVA